MATITEIQYLELLDRIETALTALKSFPNQALEVIAALEVAQKEFTNPVKLVVGGEFSSGKSLLVRMLLGREFVSTKASASAMPTVRYKYADQTSLTLFTDGKGKVISEARDLSDAEMRAADELLVEIDVAFLKQVAFYDTPGTSDPTRDIDQLNDLASQADMMIWCTNATQAWRESERKFWDGLPEHLQQNSILAVTHVDLPRVKQALPRLMKRMIKEAGRKFGDIIPIDTLLAIKSRLDGQLINNAIGWNESNGEKIFAQILVLKDRARASQHQQISQFLETNPIVSSVLRGEAPTLILDDQAMVSDAQTSVELKIEDENQFLHDWQDNIPKTGDGESIRDVHLAFLGKIQTANQIVWKQNVSLQTEIQARLSEAVEFINNAQESAGIIPDAVKQLDWEFRNLLIAQG